ncbi:hypothetical protein SCOR_25420 [Sulfidibacter corallicola]
MRRRARSPRPGLFDALAEPQGRDGGCPRSDAWMLSVRGQPDVWMLLVRGQSWRDGHGRDIPILGWPMIQNIPNAWMLSVRGQSWRDGQHHAWTIIDKNACRRHATSGRPEGTTQYSEGLRSRRRRNPGSPEFPHRALEGRVHEESRRTDVNTARSFVVPPRWGWISGTPGNQGCVVVPTP